MKYYVFQKATKKAQIQNVTKPPENYFRPPWRDSGGETIALESAFFKKSFERCSYNQSRKIEEM